MAFVGPPDADEFDPDEPDPKGKVPEPKGNEPDPKGKAPEPEDGKFVDGCGVAARARLPNEVTDAESRPQADHKQPRDQQGGQPMRLALLRWWRRDDPVRSRRTDPLRPGTHNRARTRRRWWRHPHPAAAEVGTQGRGRNVGRLRGHGLAR